MSGHWKFNSSLLLEDDFWNKLELMMNGELTVAIIGNRWWGKLKDSIRSFAADYRSRLKLDMVGEHRSIKDKLHRAVLAVDCGQVHIANTELASLQVKEHRTLVVRARLKKNVLRSDEYGLRITGQGTQACCCSTYHQCQIAGRATSN